MSRRALAHRNPPYSLETVHLLRCPGAAPQPGGNEGKSGHTLCDACQSARLHSGTLTWPRPHSRRRNCHWWWQRCRGCQSGGRSGVVGACDGSEAAEHECEAKEHEKDALKHGPLRRQTPPCIFKIIAWFIREIVKYVK